MKNLKKILVVTGCLTLISTSLAFASTNNDVNVSKINEEQTTNSFTITGYEFTYENAPQPIKSDYEKKCEELNINPSKNDKIFINEKFIDSYNINIDDYNIEPKAFIIRYKKDLNRFDVTGPISYSVNINTTVVGYGHVEKGNPVHLVQLLCQQINGSNIDPDSRFGPNTYNQVKILQGRLGVTKDGVVGKATWQAAGERY
ncbi:TPA: peptidoglycan-binding protein [Clostridioides difficile]|nr:peptidoglycan-binding protein [Clostridioides difficile]